LIRVPDMLHIICL